MSMKKQRKNPRCDDKARSLKLLPYSVRENLPILGSQQHLGGKGKALAKCLTADGACVWYITEGSARRNPDGKAVDYLLYGLVEAEDRRLDYFWLSDLATLRSSTEAAVVRDLHWQPKMLEEIAPELFRNYDKQLESQPMKKHSQDDQGSNDAAAEVPVSIGKPSGQKPSRCRPYRKPHDSNAEHGRVTARPKRLWVLAIADRGVVVHGAAFASKQQAVRGLAEYLRANEDYDGSNDLPSISDWLAEHDERLGADVFPASLQIR